MIFRKITAVLLAVVLVLSMAACTNSAKIPEEVEETPTPTPSEEPQPTEAEPTPTEAVPTEVPDKGIDLSPVKEDDGTIYAGTVKTTKRTADGEVGHEAYAGETGKDYSDEAVYTYNTAIADGSGLNWSPFAWKSEEDEQILSYLSMGLYDFVLNTEKTGWSVICEMAAELPADVTAEYVGKYGIAEGDTARAWKIVLNKNAKWDEETPINADSYIYSYKELLNPLMQNPRAGEVCTGEFAIYNAEEYRNSGTEYWAVNNNGTKTYVKWYAKMKSEDGTYTAGDGSPLAFGLKTPYAWMEGHSLEDYYKAGYMPEEVWKTLSGLADEEGYIPVTDESAAALLTFTGSDIWGNEQEIHLENYMSYKKHNAAVTWDEVGILKTGEYELVLITREPVSNPEIRVPEWLSRIFLVKEDLWEACKKYYNEAGKEVKADSEEIASVTSDYGTNAEKTASFGPYKMTSFRSDKQITFERNEQWYGYADDVHKGQYQTDVINIKVIGKHDAQISAFRKGELDSVELQSDDLKDYAESPYIRYTPQSYTTKLSFNTDKSALEQRGTQILANENFRHALSLAIDRAKFTAIFTLAGTPGYGLFNKSYLCDPYTFTVYRDTEGAKAALVGLYGVRFGDETELADIAAAYETITGYNIEDARAYMKKAYDECIADKTYDGSSKVELEILVYQNSDLYAQMAQFLSDALAEACAGTGFEGKVTLAMKADSNYYSTMYAGGADMIFSAWGGAPTELFSILYKSYCDDATGNGNQVEYGFDTSKLMVKIQADGDDYVASLQNWAKWAAGVDPELKIATEDRTKVLAAFAEYDAGTQAAIYGLLEKAYLSTYAAIPLYYRNTVSLVSAKGDFASGQSLDRVAYGGIRFYTYKYNDEEWKEEVK